MTLEYVAAEGTDQFLTLSRRTRRRLTSVRKLGHTASRVELAKVPCTLDNNGAPLDTRTSAQYECAGVVLRLAGSATGILLLSRTGSTHRDAPISRMPARTRRTCTAEKSSIGCSSPPPPALAAPLSPPRKGSLKSPPRRAEVELVVHPELVRPLLPWPMIRS